MHRRDTRPASSFHFRIIEMSVTSLRKVFRRTEDKLLGKDYPDFIPRLAIISSKCGTTLSLRGIQQHRGKAQRDVTL